MRESDPTPVQCALSAGATTSAVGLGEEFLPVLQAATAGGDAVDAYYAYVLSKAQSLTGLMTYLGENDLTDDVEGDGTPIRIAQSGDSSILLRPNIAAQIDAADGGTVYHCSGTATLLSGTNMHHRVVTALEITSVAAPLAVFLLQRLILVYGSRVLRSALASGEAGIEMAPLDAAAAVRQAAQEAANGEEVAVEGGVEAAADTTATVAACSAWAGPVVGAVALVATLVGDALQKEMVHWIDIYNLTGEELTVGNPWSDGASIGLAPDPTTVPAAQTLANSDRYVSYTSYQVQNSSGFSGLAYMVTAHIQAKVLAMATLHIPWAENNSMALTMDPGADYQHVWDQQKREETSRLTLDDHDGYQVVLTLNALSGAEDRFTSVMYVIDTAMFPGFSVPA